MSIKDVLNLIDNKLEAIFHKPAQNPEKARKPVLKGIERTENQFASNSFKAPNKWWKISNSVVAFSPKVNGTPLLINGAETNHIPSERFADFLAKLRAAVNAGELDSEIEAVSPSDGKMPSGGGATRAVRTRTPLTEEQKLERVVGSAARYEWTPAQLEARLKERKADAAMIAKLVGDYKARLKG